MSMRFPVSFAVVVFAGALACSPVEETEPPSSAAFFAEGAEAAGLDFVHDPGLSGEFLMPEIMGSGVALLDYDGDGDLDVYLVQSAGPNRLFRNERNPSGELRFSDQTEASNLGDTGYGMGVAVGDYDDDGDPDLFVSNVGANRLYRNDGGTFVDATTPDVADDRWSTSATFFDYDSDSDLDLFFTNYVDFTPRNNKDCFDPAGARDYCAPTVYRPAPDRLLRNDGGTFTDVSSPAGFGAAFGNGLGVTAADFDNDGLPDLYVANDGTANQLWMNQGDGTFENTALMAGAAYNADGLPEAGMGVSAADFDGDGDEDLFMTHLAQETNTLYLNNGRGEFRDETNRYGLGGASTPFTGFGMRFFDYDADGLLDLFVANGGVTIVESQRGDPYPYRQTNLLFRFDSQRFVEVTERAGPAYQQLLVGRGAAFGDLDLDGDTDIVVNNNNGPASLLLNQAAARGFRVRIEGSSTGARVALVREGVVVAWRRIHRDGSYLSSSEPVAEFGALEEGDRLGVVWRDGVRETFLPAPMIQKGAGDPWP